MSKVKYLGVSDPAAAFEALRPAYNMTIRMMTRCKPSGADYVSLLRITEAMNDAAQHFMPRPGVSFFGSKPTG